MRCQSLGPHLNEFYNPAASERLAALDRIARSENIPNAGAGFDRLAAPDLDDSIIAAIDKT